MNTADPPRQRPPDAIGDGREVSSLLSCAANVSGVTAILALLTGGLLAAVSLLFLAFGPLRGQLLFAGLAELLVSVLFLAAGVGMFCAVARAAGRATGPSVGDVAFVLCGSACAVCWTVIGVNGLFAPVILGIMIRA